MIDTGGDDQMYGPDTSLTIEAVLGELAREVKLAERLARLRWDAPASTPPSTKLWNQLRELALGLARPQVQFQCCTQTA